MGGMLRSISVNRVCFRVHVRFRRNNCFCQFKHIYLIKVHNRKPKFTLDLDRKQKKQKQKKSFRSFSRENIFVVITTCIHVNEYFTNQFIFKSSDNEKCSFGSLYFIILQYFYILEWFLVKNSKLYCIGGVVLQFIHLLVLYARSRLSQFDIWVYQDFV